MKLVTQVSKQFLNYPLVLLIFNLPLSFSFTVPTVLAAVIESLFGLAFNIQCCDIFHRGEEVSNLVFPFLHAILTAEPSLLDP